MIRAEQNCVLAHRRDPDRPRRAVDSLRACYGHRTGLARTLLELPDMYRRLAERHIASGRGLSEHRPSGHHGLAINDKVATLRGDFRTNLRPWVYDVWRDRGFTLPAEVAAEDPYHMARYIWGHRGANLDWWCARDDLADFHDTVDLLHRRAFPLLYPTGRRRFEVGACIEVTTCDVATRVEQCCRGRMLATLTDADDVLPATLYCDECGVEITADRWITYGRRVHKAMEAAS